MYFLDKILKNRIYLTGFISVSIFLFIFILSVIGNLFYHINKDFQYLVTDYFDETPISQEIVIVGIDEKTLEKLGRFPFDRSNYIPIVENLNNEGASIIAFDIIFADKTNEVSDNAFSQAIKNAGNIIIGMSFSSQQALEKPLDIFEKYIIGTGFYSPYVDPITNAVYSYKPFYEDRINGKIYEHFAVTIAKEYLGIDSPSQRLPSEYLLDETTSLTFEQKGSPLVYISGVDKTEYPYISFYDVYDENEFKRVKNQIDLEGKIFIIGATAKGIKDTFNTANGLTYGVYFHANALSSILQNGGFTFLPRNLEWVFIFLIIVISGYFNLSRSGKILLFSNVFVVILFGILFPLFTFIFTRNVTNYFYELFLALLMSLAVSNIFKYMIENKHKNKLNKALGEYVSKDIAAEILSGSGTINLDGQEKKVTVFFSDIEGFTSISEKFSPKKLVSFLRKYLSRMSHIIMDERGMIDKFEGDAIMALWGVFPSQKGRDIYNACESALKQQEDLLHLNRELEREGFPEIKVRMGIHTGNAIVGNIGAEGRKMEFTALGDNINLASRLEGVNKFYGTYICVSEDIVSETIDDFSYRYLDKIRVKGKDNPVVIYELLSRKGCLSEEKKSIVLQFTEGIKLYLSRDFDGAIKVFNKCFQESNDGPSRTYYERSKIFLDNPPEKDWDGVWNHDEK